MAYRVSVAGFEGPFDLLLQLVMRQKIDIGTVSVSAVADQYLAEVANMPDVDLEVASDFVLVAATLLDLKAAALVQGDPVEDATEEDFDDGYEDLTADEMRDVLVARLMAYRTYKMAAAALESRMLAESKMHPRTIGPDERFRDAAPDFLKGVTLDQLARTCARFWADVSSCCCKASTSPPSACRSRNASWRSTPWCVPANACCSVSLWRTTPPPRTRS